jgi:hypothetical protein
VSAEAPLPSLQRRVVALGVGAPAEALAALAAERGWSLVDDVPRGHHAPRALVWAVDAATRLGYVEEHQTGTRRLELTGPDPVAVAELDAWLRERLDHHDEAAVLAGAGRTNDPLELLRALPVVASFQPALEDAAYLAVYRRALNHPLRAVRRVAALSAAARSSSGAWPGLGDLVAERQAIEPDPTLASMLVRLGELLDDAR